LSCLGLDVEELGQLLCHRPPVAHVHLMVFLALVDILREFSNLPLNTNLQFINGLSHITNGSNE
jgi:hypothetical protein